MRAMFATTSHDQDPCAILFDMHAAFLSVGHHYLQTTLHAMKIPQPWLHYF